MSLSRGFMLGCLVLTLALATGCEKDYQDNANGSTPGSDTDSRTILQQFEQQQASAGTATGAPTALMPADLAARIDEAVRLLEAKDYTALVNGFTLPETLKALKSQKTDTDLAKDMEAKADQLLPKLKEAKTLRPTIAPDGNSAKFPNDVAFQKVDAQWYLAD
ncbi:MAG: hypothetical protein BIFFINMI_01829 [Phycisphaerae bacterium]|nr:hypothetical protein [Phycisphaerae bacterium]